jgi:hypothetical protein
VGRRHYWPYLGFKLASAWEKRIFQWKKAEKRSIMWIKEQSG